ncbi:MAG: hypothetical protein RR346_00280 [Bacteroidales bacterium]
MQNRQFLAGLLLSIPICFLLLWFANIKCNWANEDYKKRIWLHRANTPEKLREFAGEYDGYECDVILRDSVFDVTHDMPVSHGIGLNPYFSFLQNTNRQLWLDIKNLTFENKSTALNIIKTLCRDHLVNKDQLIIESNNWEALSDFKRAGFYTSYYIPIEEINRMGLAEKEDALRLLNRIAQDKAVDAFSFYGRYYYIIKKEIYAPIDLLTWEHHHSKEVLSLLPRGRKLLQDSLVKIILVKDKGHYHK